MFFGTQAPLSPALVAGALVLSFLLAMVFAAVYQHTFRGFTYSRSYIHSMVLGSMVTCMLIMAVGNNLARGMGILGTLAIIRFRTPVRDPRDAMFLFACLGVGIACGAEMPLVAVIGTFIINAAALLLHWAPFASRREYEGLFRFLMPANDAKAEQEVQELLKRYCSSFTCWACAMRNKATAWSSLIRCACWTRPTSRTWCSPLRTPEVLATPCC